MHLQLLASATTQATWGLVLILLTTVAVFTPWGRLRKREADVVPALDESSTPTVTEEMREEAAHALPDRELVVVEMTEAIEEVEVEVEVQELEVEAVEEIDVQEVETEVVEAQEVEVVEAEAAEVVEIAEEAEDIVEVDIDDVIELGTVEKPEIDVRESASVAAEVQTDTDVIRIDIAGPKPDGTFDSVPHHHH